MAQVDFSDIIAKKNKKDKQKTHTNIKKKTKNHNEKAQEGEKKICDKVKKTLHEEQKGYKFMCTGTIFPRGNAALEFSAACLWNSKTDGSLTVQYENDYLYCFVCLFVVSP